jgi:predicted amidohydrolase
VRGTVVIALLQFAPQSRTPKQNVAFIASQARELKNALVVLPEFFLGSYADYPLFFPDFREITKVLQPLLALTSRRRITFVGSLPVRVGAENYNRALMLRDGEVQTIYDKVKLFGTETDQFANGESTSSIVEIDGLKCSVQICMDIADPVALRSETLRGAQVVLSPSAVSVDYLRHIHRGRAIENQTVSVFCNRSGAEPGLTRYMGNSAIFMPDGSEQALDADAEGLQSITVDPAFFQTIDRRRRELLRLHDEPVAHD